MIDGSQGEGGGQIFRTSLTLAMCLGQAVCIENIRAGRAKPGLLRQHLACLKAAKEICGASVEGEELGSKKVTFIPGEIKAGSYCFSVGTAGSSTLIFQTILMPLLFAKDKSEITLQGGTHNAMAPSFDFIEKSFLPLLKIMGADVDAALESYGFYPIGGGKWSATIYPLEKMHSLELVECNGITEQGAEAVSCKVPHHVTARELNQIKKRCCFSAENLQQRFVESVGPGNVVSIYAAIYAPVKTHSAVFVAFGERNVSAERVANKAIDLFEKFHKAEVPVCEYLADQLLLPMALGSGGVYRTTEPSQHLLSNIDVIQRIANIDIDLRQVNDLSWEVRVNQRLFK